MVFNTIPFFLFLFFLIPLYFSIPGKSRWFLLLIASYLFYGYHKPVYICFLIFPTVLVYFLTRILSVVEGKYIRVLFLVLGISSGLLLLLIFKYSDFVGSTLHSILGLFKEKQSVYHPFGLILPIGISFFSFKLVSYVIDVYNETIKAERHFGYFALYVSFFPQILAGPIDRAVNLLPQLKQQVRFDYERVCRGMQLMLWGFFKKIVIADHLALAVSNVYRDVTHFEGIPLLITVLFYSIQIYCDFSGYSDIAIGLAGLLGFKSMDNFDAPYFSKDIKQFWNKWHISLSTWLRDYLFLPIAYATMRRIPGSALMKIKVETWGYVVGMFFTMFLGGLWHGASWTFVFWGIIHGFYLIASHTTKKLRKKVTKSIGLKKIPRVHYWLKVIITFNMVTLAWIFFRAKTIPDAIYVITHMFNGIGKQITSAGLLKTVIQSFQLNEVDLIIIVFSIIFLFVVDFYHSQKSIILRLAGKPPWLRWGIYILLIFFILWFGEFKIAEFIYFRF